MPADARDPQLAALAHPFSTGLVDWPDAGQALFLRGRMPLPVASRDCLASQPFRPAAQALEHAGIALVDEDDLAHGRFPLVLALPPRQRDEARALLARACLAVAPGGLVMAAVANDEGARSREQDLRALAGAQVRTVAKHHCRVLWAQASGGFDHALIGSWRRLDDVRRVACAGIAGGSFATRPGIFAWDRIDPASALLAAHLPSGLRGRVADFGAGWGYLSLQVLERCPAVTAIDLFEADARALALAAMNLEGARVPVRMHWHDVTAGVAGGFDAVVCNPPFHALARGQRPDIGRAFIGSAAGALAPGGELWLVANRHLPYEDALSTAFAQVQVIAQEGGFKILRAVRR